MLRFCFAFFVSFAVFGCLFVNSYAETINITQIDTTHGEVIIPTGYDIFNDTADDIYYGMCIVVTGDTEYYEVQFKAVNEFDVPYRYCVVRVYSSSNPSSANVYADKDIHITLNELFIPTPTPNPAKNSSSSHVHEWIEGEIYAATQDTDGLEGIYCKTCGAIKESHSISAYEYTLNNYALPKINSAKPGQTVTFEFGEWNSFPKSFMEKLVEKSANGVTFVFKYKWNHKLQTITIPAGTPIDLNFDYYGPAKMAELYGMY